MAAKPKQNKQIVITSISIGGFVNSVVGSDDMGNQFPEDIFENLEINFGDFEDREEAITVWRMLIGTARRKLAKRNDT